MAIPKERVEVITAVVGLLTAIVSLVFAFSQHSQKNDAQNATAQAQTTASNAQSELSVARSSLVNLQQAYSSATAAIASLSAHAPDGVATSAAAVNVPPVRHAGPLIIVPSQTNLADLDAPATDPRWGRDTPTGDGSPDGPGFSDGGTFIYIVNKATMAIPTNNASGYAACADAPLYDAPEPATGDLSKGTNICVRTSAGRFAMLTVAKEATAQEVDFNVTVWEKSK